MPVVSSFVFMGVVPSMTRFTHNSSISSFDGWLTKGAFREYAGMFGMLEMLEMLEMVRMVGIGATCGDTPLSDTISTLDGSLMYHTNRRYI